MNGLSIRRPMPHGRHDIGWKVPLPNEPAHWYMTSRLANVAISHCGQVFAKDLLTDKSQAHKCPTCQLIESMRDELDGKNDNSK